MKLTNAEGRLSIGIKKRVDVILDAGCECGSDSARLTKRLAGAAVTVHIQCEKCGRSLSGSLRRAEVYHWQQYPEWDQGLREQYWKQRSAEHQALRDAASQKADEWQAAINRAWDEIRAEYAQWVLTSPDWKAVRRLVMVRANSNCEACLSANADAVHHLTYSYGVLPPAWELRAVCRPCHDRLHGQWSSDAHQQAERRARELLGLTESEHDAPE